MTPDWTKGDALTYQQLFDLARTKLLAAGIEEARLDARQLLLHAFGFTGSDFILKSDELVPEASVSAYQVMIDRRAAREPVSLILGEVEFMGLTFSTDKRALAPRQDSERLVELALERTERQETGQIVDLGTGSGCLILSFLHYRVGWTGIGLDISEEALSLAAENASRLGMSDDRVSWHLGSWESLEDQLKMSDLVISNPPYIQDADIPNLAPEVRKHDPRLALAGGEDGLNAYRSILTLLAACLKPGARFAFEIGFDQADALKYLTSRHGFAEFAVHKDFSGHDRVVEAVKA